MIKPEEGSWEPLIYSWLVRSTSDKVLQWHNWLACSTYTEAQVIPWACNWHLKCMFGSVCVCVCVGQGTQWTWSLGEGLLFPRLKSHIPYLESGALSGSHLNKGISLQSPGKPHWSPIAGPCTQPKLALCLSQTLIILGLHFHFPFTLYIILVMMIHYILTLFALIQ